MIADKIPACLYQPNGNSVSTERILKAAKAMIEKYAPNTGEASEQEIDEIIVCLDDLGTMIRSIQ